ncbi:hypothetical protein BsWGS_10655 [Bradybaena similaris]
MDPKQLLEHFQTFPPPPFAEGCARVALRPFLRTMQIFGAYHEHDYYSEFTKSSKEGQDYLNVVDSRNKDSLLAFTDREKTPGLFMADHVSQGPLFTRRHPSGGHFISAHDNSTDFRRRDRLYNNMAGNVSDLNPASNNDIVTININEGSHLPVSDASYFHTDNFLTQCGIVDTHLTRGKISSLGYDVTKMDGLTIGNQQLSSSADSSGFRLKSLWSDRTYAFIFVILHWANVLRCVVYLEDERVQLFTALIPVMWFTIVASCNTCMFVSCVRPDHFRMFFSKWSAIFKDPTSRRLGLRGVLTRRFIAIAVVILCVVGLLNVACIVFLMLMEDSFSAGMNVVFFMTGQRSTAVIVVSAASTFFTSTTWVGTTGFIIILCHHVQTHFQEFSQVLQLHIAAAGKDFPRSLNLLRERHVAMCDSVIVLDRYIKFVAGFSFSIFIALSCVLIYLVVRVPMDKSVMGINVFWLFTCLTLTGLNTFSMANVNEAMHAVGDDLVTLQTRNMTLEQFGQLQMFLAKANGPSMGFTVLGLVVVTRELLLTLFGIFLTYGIVLLQFP